MQESGEMCATIGCHKKAALRSENEYNAVLHVCKMRLLWESKFRIWERIEDVDFETGQITVRDGKGEHV